MEISKLHQRVKDISQAVEKLLIDIETEMSETVERNRVEAERADAVAQARREILAERITPAQAAVAPVAPVTPVKPVAPITPNPSTTENQKK